MRNHIENILFDIDVGTNGIQSQMINYILLISIGLLFLSRFCWILWLQFVTIYLWTQLNSLGILPILLSIIYFLVIIIWIVVFVKMQKYSMYTQYICPNARQLQHFTDANKDRNKEKQCEYLSLGVNFIIIHFYPKLIKHSKIYDAVIEQFCQGNKDVGCIILSYIDINFDELFDCGFIDSFMDSYFHVSMYNDPCVDKLLVLGNDGGGKSTILRQLLMYSENDGYKTTNNLDMLSSNDIYQQIIESMNLMCYEYMLRQTMKWKDDKMQDYKEYVELLLERGNFTSLTDEMKHIFQQIWNNSFKSIIVKSNPILQLTGMYCMIF